jgi:cysteine desulfurase
MIYLDHGATTPVAPEVLEAMQPFFSERFGNPSSLYSLGRDAKEVLETSRTKIAKRVNALKNHNLVFVSSATESNNFAIKGSALANQDKGKHIITTKIEHKGILNSCKWLDKQGFEITYLPVDKQGFLSPEDLENAIRKDTILFANTHANSEIGTIQDIEKIGKICSQNEVLYYLDAAQTFTKHNIDVAKQNIDLLTLSSHKIYGPKGAAAIVFKKDIKVTSQILHGGGQESGFRSSTENIPAIVGFAKASEVITKKDISYMQNIRDMLIKGSLETNDSWLNGPTGDKRLCNNTNISFNYIEGESLLLHLDAEGIAVSTGSACSSKTLEPSHVLSAIGLKPEEAHGTLRMTLGKDNTKDEINHVIEVIQKSVETLRKISPLTK